MYTYMCMLVCMSKCTYVCVYVYMCTHIPHSGVTMNKYIHTHYRHTYACVHAYTHQYVCIVLCIIMLPSSGFILTVNNVIYRLSEKLKFAHQC